MFCADSKNILLTKIEVIEAGEFVGRYTWCKKEVGWENKKFADLLPSFISQKCMAQLWYPDGPKELSIFYFDFNTKKGYIVYGLM